MNATQEPGQREIRVAALFGGVGVALGAFGAHGLRGRISDTMLDAYQTGVHYHLLHAVVLLALGLYRRSSGARVGTSFWLLSSGIVLFSGSLYALALSGIRLFGLITPLGGLAILAGWAALFVLAGKPRAS